MSENALTVRDEMTLADTMTLGKTLSESGYFSDARQAAQAVVKVLAGRELGVGPIAAMTGIHIIHGQVSIGGNILASVVKRDPRYDYKVIELSDERCELAFFERGAEIGRSTFTMEDAKKTLYWNTKTSKMESLASKFNWQSYPRNMMFNRSMSNGYKWYCPDAGGGIPLYTPEELGANVDESGALIDVTPEQRATIDDDAELAEARREAESIDPLTPTDNRPDTPPTAKRSWPGATIKAVVDAGHAEHPKQAVAMLNRSVLLVTTDDLERIMGWTLRYRTWRDNGKDSDGSARMADMELKQAEKEGE